MVWLRQEMQHIPPDADPDTLRQYAKRYSWGSSVLAWTYRSLSSAAYSETTNLEGCVPLIMSRSTIDFLRGVQLTWMCPCFHLHGGYPACPSRARIIRPGGFLYGVIDSINATWRNVGGRHMDQMTFVSSHQSGYDLVQIFGLGGHLSRLCPSTWYTCTMWTE
ncbi:hypothetical protein PIB30_085704 [Stylosanthes scabra]|uniref:Uncharacterized protein n=1 Tax=Stylosanthes scabra TaxID=79078 RepID=A0ABU6VU36_9FABA|nr:hypothetical protein [Stylosanthes scabra]